jgi:hypothetical protein
MSYIGIDPGMSGGIAVLWEEALNKPQTYKMPREPEQLTELLRQLVEYRTQIFIEQVPKFCGLAQFGRRNIMGSSMAVMYGNFQLAVGICHGLGHPPALLPPVRWQNLVQCRNFERLDRGPWKNRLKARAQEIFPETRVTLASADALLIAYAGRLVLTS